MCLTFFQFGETFFRLVRHVSHPLHVSHLFQVGETHLFQVGETCVSPFSIPSSNTGYA